MYFLTMCNELKISDYKVYWPWLTDFPPLIIIWARQEIIMVISKKKCKKTRKKAVQEKIDNFTVSIPT